jgi:hypothetical protein
MKKENVRQDYLLLFRGGADPQRLTRKQMQQIMKSWFDWIERLKQAGQFQAGHPLKDSGKVVSGRQGRNLAGFIETRETVVGYLILSARNLAEATKIARDCPILEREGTVEVRPILPEPGA